MISKWSKKRFHCLIYPLFLMRDIPRCSTYIELAVAFFFFHFNLKYDGRSDVTFWYVTLSVILIIRYFPYLTINKRNEKKKLNCSRARKAKMEYARAKFCCGAPFTFNFLLFSFFFFL